MILILTIIAWITTYVHGAMNMTPGDGSAASARLYDARDKHLGITPEDRPAAERAWAEMEAALAIVTGVIDEANARVLKLRPEGYFDFTALSRPAGFALDDVKIVYPEAVRLARAIRASDFGAMLDRSLAEPHAVPPRDMRPWWEWRTTTLAAARKTARYLAGDMALSIRENDEAAFVRSFERAIGIASRLWPGVLTIEPMVAESIESYAILELERQLLRHRFSPEAMERLDAALARAAPFDADYLLQTERLYQRMLVDSLYTDDGNGRGRLVVTLADEKFRSWFYNIVFLFEPWDRFTNLTTLLYADKKAMIDEIDRRFAELRSIVATPPAAREDKVYKRYRDEVGSEVSSRFVFVSWQLETLGGVMRRMEEHQCEVAGVRTLLALERYRARHGGYPPALDALVPEFLDALPIDIYSGRPFVYKRVAREPAQGRAFVLYGVGVDGVDDGGDFRSAASGGRWRTSFVREICRDWPFYLDTTDMRVEGPSGYVEWTPPDLSEIP